MTKPYLKMVLREAYDVMAPRNRRGGIVAPAEYAMLTKEEIDEQWDYDHRHLAHKIAKAIVSR